MKHVVVPVNPTLEDTDLKDQSKVNIPFPENRKTSSINTNISECCVFLYWITRYIFIFFALSFIGKIAALYIGLNKQIIGNIRMDGTGEILILKIFLHW